MLTCFLAIPVGFISLIVSACMRRTRLAIVAGVVFIISSLAIGVPFFHWLSNPNPIRTAVNAAPEEVTFLKLPITATNVSYFGAFGCWMAEFTLPEEDFLLVFPKFQFAPITEPKPVDVIVYGDTNHPAYEQRNRQVRKVESGLFYMTQQDNGGGFYIVYDRDASRGYFRYMAR